MFRALLVALCFTGCGSAPDPQPRPAVADGAQVVFSLQQITCQSCGAKSIHALKSAPGVRTATFDRDTAEVTVAFDPAVTDPAKLQKIVSDLGYGVEVGPGKGTYTETVEFAPGMDVTWISRGGKVVDLEPAPGKVTVFDFSATWCGPCKVVDRELLSIMELKDDVAIRKLDVTDWDAPVARHYLAKVPALPYVIVYGVKGKRVRDISGLDLPALQAAIEEGRKQ